MNKLKPGGRITPNLAFLLSHIMCNVTSKRICKTCNLEKEIDCFTFHSATGYFHRECKACANKKRRNEYAKGNYHQNRYFPKTEIRFCKNCRVFHEKEKFRTDAGKLSKSCIELIKKEKAKRTPGPLRSEDIYRVCSVCNEKKLSKEFYYYKASGYYAGECIACTSNRKKESRGKLSFLEKQILSEKDKEKRKEIRHRRLTNAYKNFDKNKGLEFDLDPEFVLQSILKDCSYCGFPATGLDRKDNTKGHTRENCVPCCWECNTARMDNFSHEEMKIIGQAIREVKLNRIQNQ